MALALGLENKRKVFLAIGLFVVLIGVVVWFFSGTQPPPPAPAQTTSAQTEAPNGSATPGKAPTSGAEAQRLSNAGIDPSLHFDKLAQSEDVRYEGTGRNIFSSESVPDIIPTPLKSARNTPSVPAVAPGPPCPSRRTSTSNTLVTSRTTTNHFVPSSFMATTSSSPAPERSSIIATRSASSILSMSRYGSLLQQHAVARVVALKDSGRINLQVAGPFPLGASQRVSKSAGSRARFMDRLCNKGTASAGPQRSQKRMRGFSPCGTSALQSGHPARRRIKPSEQGYVMLIAIFLMALVRHLAGHRRAPGRQIHPARQGSRNLFIAACSTAAPFSSITASSTSTRRTSTPWSRPTRFVFCARSTSIPSPTKPTGSRSSSARTRRPRRWVFRSAARWRSHVDRRNRPQRRNGGSGSGGSPVGGNIARRHQLDPGGQLYSSPSSSWFKQATPTGTSGATSGSGSTSSTTSSTSSDVDHSSGNNLQRKPKLLHRLRSVRGPANLWRRRHHRLLARQRQTIHPHLQEKVPLQRVGVHLRPHLRYANHQWRQRRGIGQPSSNTPGSPGFGGSTTTGTTPTTSPGSGSGSRSSPSWNRRNCPSSNSSSGFLRPSVQFKMSEPERLCAPLLVFPNPSVPVFSVSWSLSLTPGTRSRSRRWTSPGDSRT